LFPLDVVGVPVKGGCRFRRPQLAEDQEDCRVEKTRDRKPLGHCARLQRNLLNRFLLGKVEVQNLEM
jgi:hypothetical protein